MTTTDTTVNNLIINTMTQAQYSQITPSNNELYLVTDSTITSSEITSALGYTPTSPANVDGQRVFKHLDLGTVTSGSHSYNLTNSTYDYYLPDSTNIYEVMVRISAFSANTSAFTVGNVNNPATNIGSGGFYVSGLTNTNSRRIDITAPLPMMTTSGQPNGILYTQVSESNFSVGAHLYLLGYRRIGSNS